MAKPPIECSLSPVLCIFYFRRLLYSLLSPVLLLSAAKPPPPVPFILLAFSPGATAEVLSTVSPLAIRLQNLSTHLSAKIRVRLWQRTPLFSPSTKQLNRDRSNVNVTNTERFICNNRDENTSATDSRRWAQIIGTSSRHLPPLQTIPKLHHASQSTLLKLQRQGITSLACIAVPSPAIRLQKSGSAFICENPCASVAKRLCFRRRLSTSIATAATSMSPILSDLSATTKMKMPQPQIHADGHR